MKKVLYTLFGILLFQLSLAQVLITNPSDSDRKNELVSISWQEVLNAFPKIDTSLMKLVSSSGNREIPWQLEYKGSIQPQRLLMQVSLPHRGKLLVRIIQARPSVQKVKTFARFIPERMDDFAWENDRIAFRMYGKKLESKPDNAWGTDVWVKRTDKPVINEWYKKGDYHADHGEGLDYYKVGLTLGAGDIAPFINDSILFKGNYNAWKIYDNGPLRSTFRLEYEPFRIKEVLVKVSKTISIDAGSQMNKVEVNYELSDRDSIPVVAGIVKREKPGVVHLDEQKGIMSYWEPQSGSDGITGIACVFPQPVEGMRMDEQHLLTLVKVYNKKPLVYYNGAAWNKAGKIRSSSDWIKYLSEFRKKLDQPLVVEIKK